MERILLATNYPNLHELSLYDIDVEKAISLFNDDIAFTHVNKNQIASLVIDISKDKNYISRQDITNTIFTNIFTMFTNLQYLNFSPTLIWHQRLSFDMVSPNVLSSNLLELHVSVIYFTDLLYLLNECFNQLRILYVNVHRIIGRSPTIHSEEKLPNLRCFSLYSDMRVHFYDELIVPLLNRMLNLEELDLHLRVDRYKGFIDGNDLKENIINYMPRLNKFTFNICLFNRTSNQINLRSNEDIQRTFKDFKNNQIISCADYFQEKKYSYCHIYSYPYRMKYYDNITNNFPGGLFKYVHKVSLYDEHPFEHEFFLQIAQSFPFMKELTVNNCKPQKNKLYNDNKDFSIIEYPYLTSLSLIEVHDDYIEQFLLDMKMCLPYNVHLYIFLSLLHCCSVPYSALSSTLLLIEQTSARLEIIRVLSNSFRSVLSLSSNDLVHCVYLCVNKVAPEYDGIEIGIGETIIIKAIADSTGRTVEQLKLDYKSKEDLGLVAESRQRKSDIIKSLLVSCQSHEIRYLVR
ncbi:unnamed protein product [Rotaria sordida]|uniref:DNA ligase ATP-dependent N-terminal domain-containing protein n=1 Tax=Rotaria sordida TaxID=392033 RepID=A0A815H7I1_9BILA|nr:unnamed protein product [Rotaria sordida]CAF1350607.1 unnamed protein product [Rotaria sordida]